MTMRIFNSTCLGLVLLASLPAWSQEGQAYHPPAAAALGPIVNASSNNEQ